MTETVNAQWLGRVSYEAGLQLQSDLVELKAADPDAEDRLFLLEHDPVYTVGRSLSPTDAEFSGLPHPVLQINRGGKITFHGPGQLVGYPVLDLRTRGQDLHRHLRLMEEGLVEVARLAGVRAETREGLTGVWCGDRKLASIGVGVRRWVTMHGFALNVCGALEGFEHITPCGLTGVKVTSLEREGACGLDVRAAAALAAEVFRGVL